VITHGPQAAPPVFSELPQRDRRFPGGFVDLYETVVTVRVNGEDRLLRRDVGVGTTAILRLPVDG
jgi:hypothetical protein